MSHQAPQNWRLNRELAQDGKQRGWIIVWAMEKVVLIKIINLPTELEAQIPHWFLSCGTLRSEEQNGVATEPCEAVPLLHGKLLPSAPKRDHTV
jgi:hypothetical protein